MLESSINPAPDMTQPPIGTSRLTRKEQKKMIQQILLISASTVLAVVVFVFLVVPGFIKLTLKLFGPGITLGDEDTLPPQVPLLAAPPSATFSAQIAVSGYTEASSVVTFLVNGTKQKEVKAEDDGSFSADINLTKGENTLNAFARDENGNESASSQVYKIIQDSTAPRIELEEPQDGQTFQQRKNQVVTFKGITEENARIYINGRMTRAHTDGSFSTRYALQDGENKILIEAEDAAGNKEQKEITLKYQP